MVSRSHLVVVVMLVAACKSEDIREQEFVEAELAKLQSAFVARSASKVTVGCAIVTSNVEKMPAKLADEIKRLCYVEEPRMHLENAIADTVKGNVEHPGMEDISCIQLYAEDAFKTIAAHPSKDAGLQKLADEYARLCPEQVAKFRAR
jgi:hypothetical protein